MNEVSILQFIYSRLINKYSEDENIDYMTKFHNIIEKINNLQNIKRYECSSGSSGPYCTQVDFDENENGQWIRSEEIDNIINNL